MPVQFGGPIGPFLDNVQQRQVPVEVFGTADFMSNQPPSPQLDQHVQTQLLQAIRSVVDHKMATGQLTFRHLGTGDIAGVIPEIIGASGLAQQGIRIGNLTMQFGIDGHRPAGPPQQRQPQQQQVQVEARFNVGGLNINASSNKGLDTKGLQNQLADKAKSNILWYGIGCGILLVVGLGIAGLGVYIWYSAKSGMSASTGGSSSKATASTWDGKSPFTCGGNDSITINGVKANLSSTAISAGGNCSLTLASCDITAPIAIDAVGNATVTVTGGSLNGATNSVKASGNAKVNMTGTTVTGKTLATGIAKITGPPRLSRSRSIRARRSRG